MKDMLDDTELKEFVTKNYDVSSSALADELLARQKRDDWPVYVESETETDSSSCEKMQEPHMSRVVRFQNVVTSTPTSKSGHRNSPRGRASAKVTPSARHKAAISSSNTMANGSSENGMNTAANNRTHPTPTNGTSHSGMRSKSRRFPRNSLSRIRRNRLSRTLRNSLSRTSKNSLSSTLKNSLIRRQK